jgi:hypothetical protein
MTSGGRPAAAQHIALRGSAAPRQTRRGPPAFSGQSARVPLEGAGSSRCPHTRTQSYKQAATTTTPPWQAAWGSTLGRRGQHTNDRVQALGEHGRAGRRPRPAAPARLTSLPAPRRAAGQGSSCRKGGARPCPAARAQGAHVRSRRCSRPRAAAGAVQRADACARARMPRRPPGQARPGQAGQEWLPADSSESRGPICFCGACRSHCREAAPAPAATRAPSAAAGGVSAAACPGALLRGRAAPRGRSGAARPCSR